MGHIPLLWQYVSHKIAELSQLQTYEFVALVAQYNLYLRGPSIDPEIYKRGYSRIALNILEAKAAKDFNPVESQGILFEEPFERFPCANMGYVLQLFSQYETGNLPFPGSVSEQPAQIIEVFNTLSALKAEAKKSQQR